MSWLAASVLSGGCGTSFSIFLRKACYRYRFILRGS